MINPPLTKTLLSEVRPICLSSWYQSLFDPCWSWLWCFFFFFVENLCWCVWWFSEGLGIASILLLSLLFFLLALMKSLLFSVSRCCEGLCWLFWSLFCPYRHLYMSLVSFPLQIGSIFAFSGVPAKKKILVCCRCSLFLFQDKNFLISILRYPYSGRVACYLMSQTTKDLV